jgi:CheY-like chemotaxis protein
MALVDLAMPDGDGFEALRRLRAEVPATKVVLYSGFERAPLWPKLAVDGAVGYLQKGIGAAQLPRDVLALAGALDAVGAVLTHYETELAPERASVRDARRSLQKLDLPCDGDDLTLLTSELVSNALEHGSGRPRLVVQVGTDELRVEVHDDSRVLPRLRAPSEDRPGGRGLHLVQQVALAWGAEFRPSGKAVWFTLPVSVPA